MAKSKRKRARGGASVPCTCKKQAPTRVLKTRREGTTVVRRRVCTDCGEEFTTKEDKA